MRRTADLDGRSPRYTRFFPPPFALAGRFAIAFVPHHA
jgi:hypothetical protein